MGCEGQWDIEGGIVKNAGMMKDNDIVKYGRMVKDGGM